MTIADLRNLTREAAGDAVAGATDAEGTAEAEATDEQGANSDASSEELEAANGSESEGKSEALEGTDVPDDYFGYKFPPDLTPEQRSEIFAELKKRDDTIGKLLRGKEKGEETPPPPPPEPEPVSDEEILQALGLDPNDPFQETAAKAVIPLVRKQLEQENVLSQLIEMQELNEIDRSWRTSLSGLEREFGALPAEVTHDDVMEYAAEHNIGDPLSAYWQIVGPGRVAVESATTERMAKLRAAKAASATTRPGGSSVSEESPVEGKTTRAATREAASRILRELGLGDE
jgi:hypothetical protein